ncbi:MAG: hypothetical protein PVJ19_07580 [Desulfobacteraceae bacterium]|jgi:hypothetical protein
MIVPDYENIKEKKICQECYGYTKGSAKASFVMPLTKPISIYLGFLGRYMAELGKAAPQASFWPANTQCFASKPDPGRIKGVHNG